VSKPACAWPMNLAQTYSNTPSGSSY